MIRRFTILLLGLSIIPLVTLGQAPAKPTLRTILTPTVRVKPGVPPKSIRRLPAKSVITSPARTPRQIIAPARRGTPPTARKTATPPYTWATTLSTTK